MLEEPCVGKPQARFCEGAELMRVMANLNGHEAGNGGYGQGEPNICIE